MITDADVRALEASSLRAVSAAEAIAVGGWIVRAHGGPWRRVNSVHTLGDPGPDVDAHIGTCEALYRERRQPSAFQLFPATRPADLDARLAARGYRREAPTRVMTRALAGGAPPRRPAGVRPPSEEAARASVALGSDVDEAWLDALVAWEPRHAAARGRFRELLRRAGPEPRFAVATVDGRAVSVGLGVRDGERLGLFDLATDPGRRGRGLGSRVLDRLLVWGFEAGARLAWLQVEEANPRARDLYVRWAFADAYPYWYRVRPE